MRDALASIGVLFFLLQPKSKRTKGHGTDGSSRVPYVLTPLTSPASPKTYENTPPMTAFLGLPPLH